MEVHMAADMEVDKVANKVADMVVPNLARRRRVPNLARIRRVTNLARTRKGVPNFVRELVTVGVG